MWVLYSLMPDLLKKVLRDLLWAEALSCLSDPWGLLEGLLPLPLW